MSVTLLYFVGHISEAEAPLHQTQTGLPNSEAQEQTWGRRPAQTAG